MIDVCRRKRWNTSKASQSCNIIYMLANLFSFATISLFVLVHNYTYSYNLIEYKTCLQPSSVLLICQLIEQSQREWMLGWVFYIDLHVYDAHLGHFHLSSNYLTFRHFLKLKLYIYWYSLLKVDLYSSYIIQYVIIGYSISISTCIHCMMRNTATPPMFVLDHLKLQKTLTWKISKCVPTEPFA